MPAAASAATAVTVIASAASAATQAVIAATHWREVIPIGVWQELVGAALALFGVHLANRAQLQKL
jgi:hypothetical protein